MLLLPFTLLTTPTILAALTITAPSPSNFTAPASNGQFEDIATTGWRLIQNLEPSSALAIIGATPDTPQGTSYDPTDFRILQITVYDPSRTHLFAVRTRDAGKIWSGVESVPAIPPYKFQPSSWSFYPITFGRAFSRALEAGYPGPWKRVCFMAPAVKTPDKLYFALATETARDLRDYIFVSAWEGNVIPGSRLYTSNQNGPKVEDFFANATETISEQKIQQTH